MRRKIDIKATVAAITTFLIYEEESGNFINSIDRGPAKKGNVAGTKHSDGYVYITLNGFCYPAHYLVWLHKTNTLPKDGFIIDHRDRCKSNNKFKNLREATPSQNNVNSKIRTDNALAIKGVYFNKQENKYRASVWKGKKQYSCGYFASVTEAAAAVDRKRKELYGEFS